MSPAPEPSLTDLDALVLCWPGEHEAAFGGWSVRTGSSTALRANSAFPYSPEANLSDGMLERVERFFRDRARVPAFRITPFGPSKALDERLAEVDYELLEPTVVMTRALDTPTSTDSELPLVDSDERWLAALAAVAQHPDRIGRHYAAVLPRAPRDRVRVVVRDGDRDVAVALGLVQDDWVGLFDVVTAADMRGRGFARRAIRAVLDAAWARGASRAFLYVTANNERAMGLYVGLGFREAYAYHYRVLR